MTHGESGSLVIDAEVRRGTFTLKVDLTAAPGQVLGLLGPNGAGKSTLLSAVAGLTPVSGGRITLAGHVMDDAEAGTFVEASGRPVGFVFQNYRLFPHLTVAENVAFSPRARGMGRQAARSAAGHWLSRLGLTDLAQRKPDQLSGGQAQRVALARALAGQPALLLLDDAPGFEDDELVGEHERFERVVGDKHARPGELRQVPLEFGLHVKAGSCVQG